MTVCPSDRLLMELRKTLFPETVQGTKDSVRLRAKQVMTKVKKAHARAYILSHATRLLYTGIQEKEQVGRELSLIQEQLGLVPSPVYDSSAYCQFDALQRHGADCLKTAIDASMERLASVNSENCLQPGIGAPHVKKISIASLLNRRRRQEDRWFLVADLLKYAPTGEKLTDGEYPMILGCGVFDGHGGPEAAEHCSNLAPLLLSRRLQRRFLPVNKACKSQETIPDILASVIDDLNFSVSECHREKLWNSGTTATVCLLHEDFIYTAWVGDSQAVLFSCTPDNTVPTATSISTKQATSHQTKEGLEGILRSVACRSNSMPSSDPPQKPSEPLFPARTAEVEPRILSTVTSTLTPSSKRQSTHFSEPSLQCLALDSCPSGVVGAAATNGATTASVEAVGGALNLSFSAGASHISPAGDLRSRTQSISEKPRTSRNVSFTILTDFLHRPEQALEFVSILRAGGCVTFKPNAQDVSPLSLSPPMPPLKSDAAVAPFFSNNTLQLPDLSLPGTYRVGGMSGVARAIGADTNTIRGMCNLPSVSVYRRPPRTSGPLGCCLIIASDGLWDTYGCSAFDCACLLDPSSNPAPTPGSHSEFSDAAVAWMTGRDFAKSLANRAARNGSMDNITVLVIWLEDPAAGLETVPEHSYCPTLYPISSRTVSLPSVNSDGLVSNRVRGFARQLPTLSSQGYSRSLSLGDLTSDTRLPARISSPIRRLP
ncbi:hypothetical protein AAHC03_01336 [Spirometra sp. Aus1]